ncbi:MAG: hypothetical protein GF350_00445, partial [Chitinivibrionales bacterium]|nr:hypothetical protein [Chitinivibrionales bacterium]
YIAGLCAVAFIAGCSNSGEKNPVAGELGPGTEVIGKVVDETGQPVAEALAVLRPSYHKADTTAALAKRAVDSAATYTDDAGVFIFREIDSGAYRIEVIKQGPSGEATAALFSFFADDSMQTLDLHTDTVLPVVTLNGAIDTTGFRGLFSGFVFAAGLDKAARCSGSGSFSIAGLPQDELIELVVGAQSGTIVMDSSVAVSTKGVSPIRIPPIPFPVEYIRDTLAVRALLDTNNLRDTGVLSVVHITGVKIDTLWLDTLALKVIPSSIGELGDLAGFYCTGNVISTLPDEFAQCRSLKTLDLANNNLTAIPDAVFILDSLVNLYLTHNEIDSIPLLISSLVNLETFYIQTNYIRKIPPELFSLPNLKQLSFARNRLSSLPSETGQCITLEKLSISDNRIDSLPQEICNLVNLEELLCGKNLLESIPSCLGTFSGLFSIEVHENELISFPGELVSNLYISHLRVDHNRLCSPAVPDSVRSWFDIMQPGWDTTQVCQ